MADSPILTWKIGVEIELIAPRGLSRRDLAGALAGPDGGVRTIWHTQSEPAEVPGTPIFHNLTQGFDVTDPTGAPVARLVDDLTLVADLNRAAPPQPGWYRVVSDDTRLLRLVARHADPALPPETSLRPIADLFGSVLQPGPGGMVKLVDELGVSVALAAPLPGERERGAELITPPLASGHGEALERLLAPARALGFQIPAEAAVHLHFDAAPLTSAAAVRGLVRLWTTNAELLRSLVGTNRRCRRLGDWPPALLDRVEAPDWIHLEWSAARAQLAALNLSKFCDLNLRNLALALPDKHTVEVRVLPGALHAAPILEAAALFEALLRAASADIPAEPARPVSRRAAERLIGSLPLDPPTRQRWLRRAAGVEGAAGS